MLQPRSEPCVAQRSVSVQAMYRLRVASEGRLILSRRLPTRPTQPRGAQPQPVQSARGRAVAVCWPRLRLRESSALGESGCQGQRGQARRTQICVLPRRCIQRSPARKGHRDSTACEACAISRLIGCAVLRWSERFRHSMIPARPKWSRLARAPQCALWQQALRLSTLDSRC
jgi:hypothetical protein